MDVLTEILNWSKDRPAWQRDALRRLVLNSELVKDDIDALTEIAKSAHGLAEPPEAISLGKEHLPTNGDDTARVDLKSIYHGRGVNALAENQTLNFGPALTIVYGDNAAGKSGYTRILKSACRARGMEDILGNVLSGETPLAPVVSIKYTVGTNQPQEWAGEGEDDYIGRVSVFDTHCASVYLTQQTDVAFRPFGLDLFDKLVKACQSVRANLQSAKSALGGNTVQAITLPEGTKAAKFLGQLSSLTKVEALKALTTLSEQETARVGLLEKQLLDLQANDPAKAARELSLRAGRIRSFLKHLEKLDRALSDDAVGKAFASQADVNAKGTEAESLRQATFPADLLTGTGSERWAALWEAARAFSEENAYTDKAFPVTDAEALCVLCQQALGPDAEVRLKKFHAFVVSVSETEFRNARQKYTAIHSALNGLEVSTSTAMEAVKEIRVEDEALADTLEAALSSAEARRKTVLTAFEAGTGLPADLPGYDSPSAKVNSLTIQLDERVTGLKEKLSDEGKDKIETELQELKARQALAKHEETVLEEIERRKKVAAYGQCIEDTRTGVITHKSTAVTKVIVTQQLKKAFLNELKNLKFKHVEVELTEVGGEFGNLYHKLVLKRAPGVELPKIVSEGEARCLSIAAFFAELSTADDPSAIFFDDPVSSLDYKWRKSVARRLVEEAKTRQVVVFTHDVVFLLILKQLAEQEEIDLLDQHVRQLQIGAGVCAEELPWVAMPVKKRIGHLKHEWQQAEKLHKEGHQAAYEKEATYLYGLLREAWERGLEEVLLGGVVERYRTSVQTRQIERISDITPEDCKTVEVAMTKCSQWLPGHDQAPAAKQDVPDPDELKVDIEALETWVKGINKRRN